MKNIEQAEYWNGRMGDAWTSVEHYIDQLLEPLSSQAIALAKVKSDDVVLDVGCGCGTTSLQIARTAKRVLGVDISHKMIDQAQEKTRDNLSFSVADAADESFERAYSLLFSRFGVMFFAEPISAFANLRKAMSDNGRMAFLCWQAPPLNPWMSIPGAAIQPYLPADTPPPDPQAPGPFTFGDANYAKSVVESAGFHDFTYQPIEADLFLGQTLDEVMAFQTQVGPLSALLASADAETGQQAMTALEEALRDHMTPDGLTLPAAAALLMATR